MALFSRWVIEANDGPPGTNLWIVAGSVMGAKDPAEAISKFQQSGPAIDQTSLLRAIPWDHATEDQQEIAGIQDERRGFPMGGVLGARAPRTDNAPPWEVDYAMGRLPIGANTPSKAMAIVLAKFLLSLAIVIGGIAGIVLLIRRLF